MEGKEREFTEEACLNYASKSSVAVGLGKVCGYAVLKRYTWRKYCNLNTLCSKFTFDLHDRFSMTVSMRFIKLMQGSLDSLFPTLLQHLSYSRRGDSVSILTPAALMFTSLKQVHLADKSWSSSFMSFLFRCCPSIKMETFPWPY